MRNIKIYVGSLSEPAFFFENNDIYSVDIENSVDVSGSELAIDVSEVEVKYDLSGSSAFAPSDYDSIITDDDYTFSVHVPNIMHTKYGTPVWIYREQEFIGKFFVQTVERTGARQFKLNLISAIGLLDKQTHFGGVYVNKKFKDLVDDILNPTLPGGYEPEGGTTAIDFVYAPGVDTIGLTGYLPYASKRENLHQAMLAAGVSLLRADNGDAIFSFLKNDDPQTISEDDTYDQGAVEYPASINIAKVTEHTYVPNYYAQPVTLFDNSAGVAASETMVKFETAPILVSSLQTAGSLSIVTANENCAIVNGTGVLTGLPYAHSEKIINHNVEGAVENNEVSVSDCTLVSALNSNNVLRRLVAYYVNAIKVKMDFVHTNERCGRYFEFSNPFRETMQGFMQRKTMTISGIIKDSADMITNYSAVGGNTYNRKAILTGSGTWTVPNGVSQIRVVLIGGGCGGESGFAGKNGGNGPTTPGSSVPPFSGSKGEGGKAGNSGEGGKVWTEDVQVSAASYEYDCGIGGDGGAQCTSDSENNLGQLGTDTTFGTLTTQYGSRSDGGVLDLFNGDVYAAKGNDGADGGDGGWIETYDGIANPPNGDNVVFDGVTYYGGTKSQLAAFQDGQSFLYCEPSCGGGAAKGLNGGDGVRGYKSGSNVYGAQGGKGANATNRSAETTLGKGGAGGHGGGGGGGGGWVTKQASSSTPIQGGAGGLGGYGGAGGKGGDGCIIIYY